MDLYSKDKKGTWHNVVEYDGVKVTTECGKSFPVTDNPSTRPPLGQLVCRRCFQSLL